MKQTETSSIASDLEFSKNIIDGFMKGNANAVEEASRKVSLTPNEKKEMVRESQDVAKITKINALAIDEVTQQASNLNDLILESLDVAQAKPIPKSVKRNIQKISENSLRYRKYLLKFLRKYS